MEKMKWGEEKMKKRMISLFVFMVVVLLMTNLAFADTAVSDVVENKKISTETRTFLYGDWKIQSFLGTQKITKDESSHYDWEKVLGKVVIITQNIFSIEDFGFDYESYAVNILIDQYDVIDRFTGKEFRSKYDVSKDVTMIQDVDQVQVIQIMPKNKTNSNFDPVLIDVNNERLLLCMNGNYFELGKNIWSQNDMSVAIYDPNVNEDGFFHVKYLNNEAERVPEEDSVRLLMVNGGFVPYPDIKVVNNRMLVPLEFFSEQQWAKVDWDEEKQTIEITKDETKISLIINNHKATINNKTKTIEAAPVISDGKVYVPVRFVAEALSADVGYISQFSKYEDRKKKTVSNVSVITIEKPDENAIAYSVEEGLAKVKEASVEEYNVVLNILKEYNCTFDDVCPDYDAQDITYANQTVGRYYVYKLAAFSEFDIYFNKYTGEIYSQCDALPFLFIVKDFINISWMYQ